MSTTLMIHLVPEAQQKSGYPEVSKQHILQPGHIMRSTHLRRKERPSGRPTSGRVWFPASPLPIVHCLRKTSQVQHQFLYNAIGVVPRGPTHATDRMLAQAAGAPVTSFSKASFGGARPRFSRPVLDVSQVPMCGSPSRFFFPCFCAGPMPRDKPSRVRCWPEWKGMPWVWNWGQGPGGSNARFPTP